MYLKFIFPSPGKNSGLGAEEPFLAVWFWHTSCVKCLLRELTGVHQEILILCRLVAVHSSPVLEVTLFYSGWQLCHYWPRGGHGNLLCSNVPGLHVYPWNTGDTALSVLNAVLIKSISWQHYGLCCNLYTDLTFWPASASSVPDVEDSHFLQQGWGVDCSITSTRSSN